MTFFAPGKLMISGEYVVLNGVTAFAVPVQFGQSMQVLQYDQPGHKWQSYDTTGKWFEVCFSKDLTQIKQTTDPQKAVILQNILQYIRFHKPTLWYDNLHFITQLNFNRSWGLGSSSSLIVLLHQWSGINPFKLLDISFGGSGYDIAVALEKKALWYRLSNDKDKANNYYRKKFPIWQTTVFKPSFLDKLYFIYSNRKQNSRREIINYQKTKKPQEFLFEIDLISRKLPLTDSLLNFENLLKHHEQIISKILQRPTIQSEFFEDYPGVVKSLGAWGGDFFIATGDKAPSYFRQKGFDTIFSFKQMVL